ncbi:MAG: ATPase [Methylobacteriaceae bacterium]|jgi:chaperone required for assembly of F1-ATPase|nr:ATPase [Methylobacteriaceae bacterium]
MADTPLTGGGGLKRRFYRDVFVGGIPGAYEVLLDGRRVHTPGRKPLRLPAHALARAVADEWHAQQGLIRPETMPLTRLANTVIDGVAAAPEETAESIMRYAASDLLCYRAAAPDSLARQQALAWDGVLDAFHRAHGARFRVTSGIGFIEQAPETVDRVRAVVGGFASPFALGALHVLTTLSGSVVLALELAEGRLGVDEAWRLAHLDELFQESLWGEDAEALNRRARRFQEFCAAFRMLAWVHGKPATDNTPA